MSCSQKNTIKIRRSIRKIRKAKSLILNINCKINFMKKQRKKAERKEVHLFRKFFYLSPLFANKNRNIIQFLREVLLFHNKFKQQK